MLGITGWSFPWQRKPRDWWTACKSQRTPIAALRSASKLEKSPFKVFSFCLIRSIKLLNRSTNLPNHSTWLTWMTFRRTALHSETVDFETLKLSNWNHSDRFTRFAITNGQLAYTRHCYTAWSCKRRQPKQCEPMKWIRWNSACQTNSLVDSVSSRPQADGTVRKDRV